MDKEYYEEPTYEYDTIIFEENIAKVVNEAQLFTTEEFKQNIDNIFPDYWISENRNMITYIFEDLKEMSQTTSFCDNCNLDDFCDYMDYVNNSSIETQFNWDKLNLYLYVNKYSYRKNPTFKQYMSHYLIELYDLYSYLSRKYTMKCGTFEVFSEFVYITSSSNKIITIV